MSTLIKTYMTAVNAAKDIEALQAKLDGKIGDNLARALAHAIRENSPDVAVITGKFDILEKPVKRHLTRFMTAGRRIGNAQNWEIGSGSMVTQYESLLKQEKTKAVKSELDTAMDSVSKRQELKTALGYSDKQWAKLKEEDIREKMASHLAPAPVAKTPSLTIENAAQVAKAIFDKDPAVALALAYELQQLVKAAKKAA